MPDAFPLDVVIFGGGAAGLWLLDDLTRQGYGTLLLEAHDLGRGQTIASQGILHGGLKYTLSGLLTSSAKAIAEMPAIWHACLAGDSKPDLSKTKLRAEFCHLWRTTSLKSRLAMIGAKAGLRVAPVALEDHDRPPALADCPGTVARLDEQVIEPGSFLADLAGQHRGQILKINALSGLDFRIRESGAAEAIVLRHRERDQIIELRPRFVVLTAGEGNADLRARLALPSTLMQRRPLHMVMARGELPVLNAHCVDGAATRVTITTTHDSQNQAVWQIGGLVSEAGANMSPRALMQHAKSELESVLPGVDFSDVEWSTYRVDRAEPLTRGRLRPENAFAQLQGNTITAWPAKLALAPQLSKRVIELIEGVNAKTQAETFDPSTFDGWPAPNTAQPPWETAPQWFADL